MATAVQENLPPALNSTADQPPLFDGTTRLYTCYTCPFAQRVWITRNYKGLQDKIKLVPLNLRDRPAWYKEKVYPENKVPSLEHNGKVMGESLDLINYVDGNFEGPSLLPDDPAKKDFAEEMFKYADTFTRIVFTSFKGDAIQEAGPAFDNLENSLHNFDDGPFFLGGFSLIQSSFTNLAAGMCNRPVWKPVAQVDIAFISFVERFQIFFLDVWKYDITEGRPKLAAWLEEMNKIDAYKQTKTDPKELVKYYRLRFLASQ